MKLRGNGVGHNGRPAAAGRVLLLTCLLLLAIASPARSLDLTPEEQAYLDTHRHVTLCVDPDWKPFEWINERGEHEGIAADLVRLVSERTGITFDLVRTDSWEESLAASKAGRCTVLSFLASTPNRQDWLLFTDTLFRDSSVLITRAEHPFIDDPGSLSNESIVFPAGTSMEERIRRAYPNLTVLTTPTENEAMTMVSEKKADMTLRSLIVAAYTIRQEGLFNLKIAGQLPDYANKLRMGVAQGEPLLKRILDKGIATITRQEQGRIVNNHVSITARTVVDYRLVYEVAAGFGLLTLCSLFWGCKLRRSNRELQRVSRTDALTGLPNRARLDHELSLEFERSRRYGQPLSLIMLDIDHFKLVNDTFGHLVGDKVLVAIAQILSGDIRQSDTVGRWGGEEFLVVCPQTDLEAAKHLANRLCQSVRNGVFPTGQVQTISAGVARRGEADSIDSLLHRADTALYRAKSAGRDRVAALVDDQAA